MPPSGPIVHRRQVGAELRRLRETAGIRIEDVAKHLGCSQTRVSRIETARGTAVPKAADVQGMCALYGVTDERQIQMILDMLANSQKPGWWETFEDVLPSGLEVYVGLESDARTERAWEPLLVHGLLQTPDYAKAILNAWPTNRPYDIDALVQVRTERQKLLEREPNPLELWAVLDEGAIRRPVGSPAVTGAQLRHLITLAEQPNITIQILPIAKGVHPGLSGAFSILDFESDADAPVVYIDSCAGNLYVEKVRDVRRFVNTFDLLRATALAPDESVALLDRAAKEM